MNVNAKGEGEGSLTLEIPVLNPSSIPEPSKSYNNNHTNQRKKQVHSETWTRHRYFLPQTDISRTLPPCPAAVSVQGVLGDQEDQAGHSVPVAPLGPLSPAGLGSLQDPDLPARQVRSPDHTVVRT